MRRGAPSHCTSPHLPPRIHLRPYPRRPRHSAQVTRAPLFKLSWLSFQRSAGDPLKLLICHIHISVVIALTRLRLGGSNTRMFRKQRQPHSSGNQGTLEDSSWRAVVSHATWLLMLRASSCMHFLMPRFALCSGRATAVLTGTAVRGAFRRRCTCYTMGGRSTLLLCCPPILYLQPICRVLHLHSRGMPAVLCTFPRRLSFSLVSGLVGTVVP